MRSLLVFLLTAAGAVGIKLLGPLLVGLLLFGVWAAMVLFLVHLTAVEVSKLQAFKNRLREAFGPEEADDQELEDFAPALPLPDLSWIAAERRDAVLKIFSWWLALPALLFAVWAWSEPVVGWYHTLHLPTAIVMRWGFSCSAGRTGYLAGNRKRGPGSAPRWPGL